MSPLSAPVERRQADPKGQGVRVAPSSASLGSRIIAGSRAFWRGLRAVLGDDAYERYIAHHAAHHPDAPPLSRRAFYEAEQKRQWSRINRCC